MFFGYLDQGLRGLRLRIQLNLGLCRKRSNRYGVLGFWFQDLLIRVEQAAGHYTVRIFPQVVVNILPLPFLH